MAVYRKMRVYSVRKKNGTLLRDEVSEKIVETTEYLVIQQGVKTLTVRMVLKELGVTNRVFYNRFHNIDEVLNIVYEKVVLKMRENIQFPPTPGVDFFEYVEKVVLQCLLDTYELKKEFSQYTFEHDSLSKNNCDWWIAKIRELLLYGIEQKLLKEDLDVDTLSYFVWCFCRGCNADAVTRNISKEDAARSMKTGFSYFMEGIKR